MKKACGCGCKKKKKYHDDCFATCKKCTHKWTGETDRWWTLCPNCKFDGK